MEIQEICALIGSGIVSYLIIPVIINWAKKSGKLAETNHRTSHEIPTPALGGIGVFLGVIIIIPFLDISFSMLATLIGISILFSAGLVDDLKELTPKLKLFIQILCAIILYLSGIKLDSLHGVLGIKELPELISFFLTIIFVVGVTNAFNLIDGINGLAGSLALVNCFLFGFLFLANGQNSFALLAFATAFSILGFLPYNLVNAKIFMGDTGSLFLGLLMSVFVIIAFQASAYKPLQLSLAMVPMIIPIFDTLRLFVTRMLERRSPMHADKNHLHHWVVRTTKNHLKATVLITILHLLLIGFVSFQLILGKELVLESMIVLLISGVILFLAFFVGFETYHGIKQERSHLKLLNTNNRLLEKL